jgi:uncharacterized protein YacL
MRSKIIGTALVLIGLVMGYFLVSQLIWIPDNLIEYREALATGIPPLAYDSPSPEEWLQATLISIIVFLILSLLLIITGYLVAVRSRHASSVCLVTGLYNVISYVLEGDKGSDIALLVLTLLVFLWSGAFVSAKPAT